MQKSIGNQWAKVRLNRVYECLVNNCFQITKMLPGRTDNAVKNRFHATERAKSRTKFDDGPDEKISDVDPSSKSKSSVYQSPHPQHHCRVQHDIAHVQDYRHQGFLPPSREQLESDAMSDISDGVGGVPTAQTLYSAQMHHTNAAYPHPNPHQVQYPYPQQPSAYCKSESCDEGDSVTDLMELDIISFGEDDLAYYDDGAAVTFDPYGQYHQQQQQHHTRYHEPRSEIDPRCFNNDWTSTLCGGRSAGSGHASYSAPSHPDPLEYSSASIGSGPFRSQASQQHHSQHAPARFGCGLEAWGRPSNERPLTASSMMQHQQQFHAHPHQTGAVAAAPKRGGWMSGGH